jgi:hypothetical protein
MIKYIKTNQKNLVRDIDSKALINTDVEGYEMYKTIRNERKKMQELEHNMTEVKSELAAIRMLLEKLVK